MTASARIARAEARMARRLRAAFYADTLGTAGYAAMIARYQRAARVWRLRRNQAGGA